MFPESFVATQLLAFSRPGDLVFDPFSGRGTTILESLLLNRGAIGVDINPVAACVSGAKARVPKLPAVLDRLQSLKQEFGQAHAVDLDDEFFRRCFHAKTLKQILFLRSALDWQGTDVDRFIAALTLGCLHGESHRSELYLSNRMPRTISTKPDYSIRWWRERNMTPPERDCFDVLTRLAHYRFSEPPPKISGRVKLADARQSSSVFKNYRRKVELVVTSPPYIDTTDYAEDQWLRLWFMGGAARPKARTHKDDRHRNEEDYWDFLEDSWRGCHTLLADRATIVVRIGGAKLTKNRLFEGLRMTLKSGLRDRRVKALHEGVTTNNERRQTDCFRPGTSKNRFEHDFVFFVS